jgi:ribosomal-protein-alanine N-acetyltransferase
MKPRVVLRRPELADQSEFVARALASRALHQPWVTAPSTPEQFEAYVGRMQEPVNHAFLVCEAKQGSIAGVVNSPT